jgi:two-component system response regulator
MAENTWPTIVMAEDDYDDRLLIKDALIEAGISDNILFVHDGVELLDYLHRRGAYATEEAPQPDFLLLDLKMPRKNGLETLEEIRSSAELKHLPAFILTTSTDEDDRQNAKRLGANGYFTKQVTFDGLVEVIRQIDLEWKKSRTY